MTNDSGPFYDWIGFALEQARESLATEDVPVGAVLLDQSGAVIGRGPNRRVADGDPLAHAEIVAIRSAAARLGRYRLDGSTLAVTLEPCVMCLGAAMQSRVSRIVFGAWDAKAGACGGQWDLLAHNGSPHRIEAIGGIREAECAGILTDFFRARRRK